MYVNDILSCQRFFFLLNLEPIQNTNLVFIKKTKKDLMIFFKVMNKIMK